MRAKSGLVAIAVAIELLITVALALATPGPARAGQPPADFAAWLDALRQEAAAKGISQATIETALADLEPVQRILQRDRNQAEFKLTFETYLNRVVRPKTVARGREMMRTHRDLLRRVARRYRVQPRFIVAIWGIETRYGAVEGTMPVIPALATLAYDVRRSRYFRKQLFSALRMLDLSYIDLASMKGSWAGAMGQPQFIPSSYLAYAADFDGDGRRDIWRNEADVFASIANYLAKHGWADDQTWGRRVRLPDELADRLGDFARGGRSGCRAIDAMTIAKPLSAWQSLGVRRADGSDLPHRDLSASLVRADGGKGDDYLVYKNYHAVLRYNCAHHYGLTVGTLADRIGFR